MYSFQIEPILDLMIKSWLSTPQKRLLCFLLVCPWGHNVTTKFGTRQVATKAKSFTAVFATGGAVGMSGGGGWHLTLVLDRFMSGVGWHLGGSHTPKPSLKLQNTFSLFFSQTANEKDNIDHCQSDSRNEQWQLCRKTGRYLPCRSGQSLRWSITCVTCQKRHRIWHNCSLFTWAPLPDCHLTTCSKAMSGPFLVPRLLQCASLTATLVRCE